MKSLVFILSFLLVSILVGCSENPLSPPFNSGTIKISIKRIGAASPVAFLKAAQAVTVTSARVVIGEIELENISRDSMDFEFDEPFIEDLVSGLTINVVETFQVPFGSYDEFEIEIDPLQARHGDVYAENPELQDLSIIVQGYLDGDPSQTFEFTSDLESELEREFDPPLVLDEATSTTNVVITIDLDAWFVSGNGDFLDPQLQSNHDAIERNIKGSLSIFEDRDDDGDDDD